MMLKNFFFPLFLCGKSQLFCLFLFFPFGSTVMLNLLKWTPELAQSYFCAWIDV